MDPVPPTLARLADELERLPGVGRRTAERLAHHLLRVPAETALALAEAIRAAREHVRPCSRCLAPAEKDPCPICADATRDDALLMVVENARDLAAIEAGRVWTGRYLVLGARLAPHDGAAAGELPLEALLARITAGVREVVLATNADLEGDGTALLLGETLKGHGVKVSRLARGLPAGGQIEHQSASVLGEALEGRRSIS